MAVILKPHARTTPQSQRQGQGITGARMLISVLALMGILALGVAMLGGGNVAITRDATRAPIDAQ